MRACLHHSALAGGQGILYVERGMAVASSYAQEDEGADVASRSIGKLSIAPAAVPSITISQAPCTVWP